MPRMLIVGFDGATLDLCERWLHEDRMPNLAAIMRDGAFGTLRSVFPYNSAVAWASLTTGANPGRHGVFDFVLPRDGTYLLNVATRQDRRVPALWNYASDAGARVGIVNIPMTFPAEPINGYMVSGMDAPGLDERAVHPRELLERLKRTDPQYRILSNAALTASRGQWDPAERELIDTLVARSAFVAELARPRDLDLLMVNLEATDGAHHFFWQHHDPEHPRHDPALAKRFGDTIGRVYEQTDRELGRLIDAYAPDTVFVVSDHGGGPTNDWVVFINDWLADEGFLKVTKTAGSSMSRRLYGEVKKRLPVSVRRSLRPLMGGAVDRARGAAIYGDVDWSGSRAYAHMQPAVRVNLQGRDPSGAVRPAERDGVVREVAERAQELRLPTGEPVFTAALRTDEVYEGGAPAAWELILELAPGIHIRSRNTSGTPGHLRRLSDVKMYLPSGVHTPDGMVAAAGAGIDALGRVGASDIHQVVPSALALMGIPAPTLDGDPFGFVSARTASTGLPVASRSGDATELTDEEEGEVLERLRGLGYVD